MVARDTHRLADGPGCAPGGQPRTTRPRCWVVSPASAASGSAGTGTTRVLLGAGRPLAVLLEPLT